MNPWNPQRRLARMQKAFAQAFPPGVFADGDPARLRLVLGVGRSGTTWLSKVLAATDTPIRYCREPWCCFQPPLPLRDGPDPTASGYLESIEPGHPLAIACRWVAQAESSPLPPRCERDDAASRYALVKEVHALLAAPALLGMPGLRAVCILRDPVYVLDSQLAISGLDTPYLKAEAGDLADPAVAARCVGDERADAVAAVIDAGRPSPRSPGGRARRGATGPASREAVLDRMVVTIAAVQSLLSRCGRRFADRVLVLNYEDLCATPERYVADAAAHLHLAYLGGTATLLRRTQQSEDKPPLAKAVKARGDRAHGDPPHYSIYRNTRDQLARPMRFLHPHEADALRETLARLGLQRGTGRPDRDAA